MEKNIEYKQKYLKYKQKYLEKKYGLYGGSSIAVLQQQQENRLSAMARQETNKRREDAKNISATPLVEIFRSTHNAIPGFIKKMEEKLDPSHLDYITNLKVTEFIALCESLDKGIEEAQKVLLTKIGINDQKGVPDVLEQLHKFALEVPNLVKTKKTDLETQHDELVRICAEIITEAKANPYLHSPGVATTADEKRLVSICWFVSLLTVGLIANEIHKLPNKHHFWQGDELFLNELKFLGLSHDVDEYMERIAKKDEIAVADTRWR